MFPTPPEATAVLGLWVPVAGGRPPCPEPRGHRRKGRGRAALMGPSLSPQAASVSGAPAGEAPVPRGGEGREEQGRRLRSSVTHLFRRAEGGEARSPARGCQAI
ncbi:hypothetical protein NDU88_002664 [Pleurodeles waltl]|uniref:Uncharacterized protein n=1 Tax=Pleurodeles waltl TaxID=8319 RepID=A0AAV7PCB7_PLEWA|nr:hypothetical protein NDU88_002664 [Pleurodeles waltl]